MNEASIVCNPKILCGKPTIRGTRISVEYVLERLSSGDSTDDLIEGHPTLTREGIQAALAYALCMLRLESVDAEIEHAA